MTNFVWNPAWHHEGESFWSLANKIAYANRASVSGVVALLAGIVGSPSRAMFLSCPVATAVAICRLLQIGASKARYLFVGLSEMALAQREYLSLGLRWCPICLSQGVHSWQFQDWRMLECPWHNCLLLEHCPLCLRSVDPLGSSAWVCNGCNYPLFSPRSNWISLFKQQPDMAEATSDAAPVFGLNQVCVSPTETYYDARYAGTVSCPSRSQGLAIQATQWAFEEVAALTDSVLAGHRGCFPGEGQAALTQFDPIRFSCPVAAAAVCVGAWFDFLAEAVRGGWPTVTRPSSAIVTSWLEWDLQGMPVWARRLYVQASLRGWLVDALPYFLEAKKAGRDSVSWRPNLLSGATWEPKDDKIILKSHCDWPGFSRLIGTYGSSFCQSVCCD